MFTIIFFCGWIIVAVISWTGWHTWSIQHRNLTVDFKWDNFYHCLLTVDFISHSFRFDRYSLLRQTYPILTTIFQIQPANHSLLIRFVPFPRSSVVHEIAICPIAEMTRMHTPGVGRLISTARPKDQIGHMILHHVLYIVCHTEEKVIKKSTRGSFYITTIANAIQERLRRYLVGEPLLLFLITVSSYRSSALLKHRITWVVIVFVHIKVETFAIPFKSWLSSKNCDGSIRLEILTV